jgi:hypothetical protein
MGRLLKKRPVRVIQSCKPVEPFVVSPARPILHSQLDAPRSCEQLVFMARTGLNYRKNSPGPEYV